MPFPFPQEQDNVFLCKKDGFSQRILYKNKTPTAFNDFMKLAPRVSFKNMYTYKNRLEIMTIFLLSKQKFLENFRKKKQSFQEFMKTSVVLNYRGDKIPLSEYAKMRNLSHEDLQLVYRQSTEPDIYLSAFYDRSLQVDKETYLDDLSREPAMPRNAIDNDQKTKYKNLIRNLFYHEILEETQSGLANIKSFLTVVKGFYLRGEIDYKLLTPSALHYMRQNKISSNFSSFYFRASIMNPYLVMSLQECYFKAERVFTPTLGWGSYLTGFLASNRFPIRQYVGVDVIPSVCRKVEAMIPDEVEGEIVCRGSEVLAKDARFLAKYRGVFDTVFFSPPYYELEMYAGDKQSVRQYKTYEEWLAGYWVPTMGLCDVVLKRGGMMCFIISDYDKYPLVNDLKKGAVQSGSFKFLRKIPMLNKQVNYRGKDRGEQILFFRRI